MPEGMQQDIKTAYGLLDKELPHEALVISTALLQQYSPNPEIYTLEGCIRWALDQECLAKAAFHQALLLDRHFAPTIPNLAFLNMYGVEVMSLLINAVKQQPYHVLWNYSLVFALQQRGRLDEAERGYHVLLQLKPDIHARYTLGMLQLSKGDFTNGWQNFEERKFFLRDNATTNMPAWHGEMAINKVLLVEFEQGFGDFIQFIRYIEWARPLVKKIILDCPLELLNLCQNIKGVDLVLTRPIVLTFDLHCHLLSLPYLLRSQITKIPANIPYIIPDPALVNQWGTRLDELEDKRGGLLRVGLIWAGNPRKNEFGCHVIDRQRSTKLATFAPLAEISGINFFNLQKDQPYCDETWENPLCPPLLLPMRQVTDFADTAAIISQLDLVICVDTAVAHLAGAMGKEVWVLSRFAACWRWMGERRDSPWYPTLTHYKQSQPDDWAELMERVKQDLIIWRDKKR